MDPLTDPIEGADHREIGGAQVDIVRAGNGRVKRAIYPPGIEDQIMGGVMQGVGWALYEQMAYDEGGQLVTASLMDYTLPGSHQAPLSIEPIIVEVPSQSGPYGVRGVGEPPVVPVAAAIGNAIREATGARLAELPMTPERVAEAIRDT